VNLKRKRGFSPTSFTIYKLMFKKNSQFCVGILDEFTYYMALMCVGVSSTYGIKDGNDLSYSSSKSFSVPTTPRTEGEILQASNLKSFSFNDLKTATRNFRPDSVLGEGGFGCVFKGWIDEHSFTAAKPGTGIVIAAKRLNQEGLQGHKEWLVSVTSTPFFDLFAFLDIYLNFCVEP
jgi:hypothetical protein